MKTKILIICSALVLFDTVAFSAIEEPLVHEESQAMRASSAGYWTPERLRDAKPMTPMIDPSSTIPITTPQAIEKMNSGPSVSGAGQKPKVNLTPETRPNYQPNTSNTEALEVSPNNAGTFNKQFSSSRLIPLTADRAYPYKAIGKLFFTQPGVGNFVCSASVIKPRIVVTAGHCVHKGSGGNTGFYTNFRFEPAHRDGVAPFGSWTSAFVAVTNAWSTGNGTVPNAADYAMLEMNDQVIGGTLRKIGDVTGTLGYQTLKLMPNHAHLIGYPCNLDNCQKMHQVTAQSATAVSPNNVEYGSDMSGGSSGGPWVQNFGAPAVGQTGGNNPGVNKIIGITSYGYISPDPKVQGSSILDTRFAGPASSILSIVCAHRAGNC